MVTRTFFCAKLGSKCLLSFHPPSLCDLFSESVRCVPIAKKIMQSIRVPSEMELPSERTKEIAKIKIALNMNTKPTI